jgi:hypothetical protein
LFVATMVARGFAIVMTDYHGLVDGERAMQWIADRFNGLPTTSIAGSSRGLAARRSDP